MGGYPFIGTMLAVAVLAGYLAGPVFAVPPVVLMIYFVYFFRNRVLDVKQDPQYPVFSGGRYGDGSGRDF